MNYKYVFGVAAIVVAFISYIPYFRNILAGKTKPHAFSWLVWGVLNGIAFAGQLSGKGGSGAWAVGLTALVMCVIFALALYKGEKDIMRSDWLCLLGAGGALILWAITSQPLMSIILITVIDAFGFIPTFRKAYKKPHQETATTFALSIIKYLFVVVALQKYTLVTTLFPLSLVTMSTLLVTMLIVRRRQLSYAAEPIVKQSAAS